MGGLKIIKDVGRFCAVATREEDTVGLENQLDRGGEAEGVVTAVDVDDDGALENDNHEQRELWKDEDIDGDEMEQATQDGIDLSLPVLRRTGLSVHLPLSFLRSLTSHSTTFRRESRSSFCRCFLGSWLGVVAHRSTGNRGPCMLARTSLKGTVRDSSYVGRVNGWEGVWEMDWDDCLCLAVVGEVRVMNSYTKGDEAWDDPARNRPSLSYETMLRDDILLFSLVFRAAASFSLATLIRVSSSACLFSSSSLCLIAAARASRNRSFSCSQSLSHALSRSSRRLSSSFSISCLCCSKKAFSSASSISFPCGKKQRSKSSSCTAAIRGSSSDVTSMPLSFSKSTFAR